MSASEAIAAGRLPVSFSKGECRDMILYQSLVYRLYSVKNLDCSTSGDVSASMCMISTP